MNKLNPKQQASERKKTAAVMIAAALLALVNLLPLHYSKRLSCPNGGTYTVSGRTLGLPLSYFETSQGTQDACAGYADDTVTRSFSAQWLLGDAFVFGLVMFGLNVLLDRRTNA